MMDQRDAIAIQLMQQQEGMPPPEISEEALNAPPSLPMDPETMAALEAALGPPRQPGYNEWENTPPREHTAGQEAWTQEPPLPPTIMGEQPPDWATTQQGMPEFIEYPKIWGKYRDT